MSDLNSVLHISQGPAVPVVLGMAITPEVLRCLAPDERPWPIAFSRSSGSDSSREALRADLVSRAADGGCDWAREPVSGYTAISNSPGKHP